MSTDDEDAVFNEDDWEPSAEVCPVCSSATETCGWWDDPPSAGGACIGSLHRCTNCDWSDSR